MSHRHRRPRRLIDYERRHEPLAPRHVFGRRLAQSGVVALAVIAASLAIGVAGYHWIGGLPDWVDCLYNASMILGGMGPVDALPGAAGKIFASCYALYSGIALLASVGILLSPAVHRVLHRFHIETDEREDA